MKKRTYRRTPVNECQVSIIKVEDSGQRVVFAIDIAKVDMIAAIADGEGRVINTVAWTAPSQTAPGHRTPPAAA